MLEEFEVEIAKQRELLSQLENEKYAPHGEAIAYNAGDGQVGYYHLGVREGLDWEIVKARERLQVLSEQKAAVQRARLDKELNQVNLEEKKKAEKLEQEKENAEQKKFEDLKKHANYLEVRNAYKKNTSFFERIVDRASGNGLKSQAHYTGEQLEYILNTLHGETSVNISKHDLIEKKGLDFLEEEKMKKESDISTFKKRLTQSPEVLNQYIETENAMTRDSSYKK